jgi:hypothetical protein
VRHITEVTEQASPEAALTENSTVRYEAKSLTDASFAQERSNTIQTIAGDQSEELHHFRVTIPVLLRPQDTRVR